MGDVDHRDAEVLLDLLDLEPHALPSLASRLERARQGAAAWVPPPGPAQGHPLLLAAGKLAGDALGVLAQVHASRIQSTFCLMVAFVQLFDLQGIGHVVKDGHVGPDGVGLEHHADVPLLRGTKVFFGTHHPAVDADLAGGGLSKAGDHHRSMVVLRSRRAQQGDEFLSWNTSLNSFRTTTSPKALVTCLMVMVDTVIYPLMSAVIRWRTRPCQLFSSQLAMTSSRDGGGQGRRGLLAVEGLVGEQFDAQVLV